MAAVRTTAAILRSLRLRRPRTPRRSLFDDAPLLCSCADGIECC